MNVQRQSSITEVALGIKDRQQSKDTTSRLYYHLCVKNFPEVFRLLIHNVM